MYLDKQTYAEGVRGTRKFKDLFESQTPEMAYVSLVLLFLACTEDVAEKQGGLAADDRVAEFVSLLRRIPETTLYSRDAFCEVVARRVELLGGNVELFQSFLAELPEEALAGAAAQFVEKCGSLEWNDATRVGLSLLLRQALRWQGVDAYPLTPVSKAVATSMAKVASSRVCEKSGKQPGELVCCVPFAGSVELVWAARSSGMRVRAFAPSAADALVSSMLIALGDEARVMEYVEVRDWYADSVNTQSGTGTTADESALVDEEFDVVLMTEDSVFYALNDLSRKAESALRYQPLLAGLSKTCGVATLLCSTRLCYGRRTLKDREYLLAAGVDTVCELPREDQFVRTRFAAFNSRFVAFDLSAMLFVATGDAQGKDILLASTDTNEAAGLDVAELLLKRQDRPFVCKIVKLDELDSIDKSLRFSSYANTVNVAQSVESAADTSELASQHEAARAEASSHEQAFLTALEHYNKLPS